MDALKGVENYDTNLENQLRVFVKTIKKSYRKYLEK